MSGKNQNYKLVITLIFNLLTLLLFTFNIIYLNKFDFVRQSRKTFTFFEHMYLSLTCLHRQPQKASS